MLASCRDAQVGLQRCSGAPCGQVAALSKALPTRQRALRTAAAQAQGSQHQQQAHQRPAATHDKLAVFLTAAAATAALALAPPATAREPFLASSGGRGLLAEEEATLLRLREEKEAKAREEIAEFRREFEAEAEASSVGKLCATPFGVDVVGITEAIALTGALVGGYSAKQRKAELERLNEQLRKINLNLRQQARAGTLYAPGLTYVPPSQGSEPGDQVNALEELLAAQSGRPAAAVATIAPEAPANSETSVATPPGLLSTMDEDDSPEARQCLTALKDGKRFLKEENGASAMVRFEKALMLAKCLANKVQERRAVRGLAASARLTSQHRTAIKYLERVLEISREIGDNVGDADAYGTIADMYTEIGEFEKAAQYYDLYIGKMASDGSVV